jgi:hypothetical protein
MKNRAMLLRVGFSVVVLCGWALAEGNSPAPVLPLVSIVAGMEAAQAQARQQNAYQLVRQYRLSGAKSSDADSQIIAQVDFVPPGERSYTIQKASGSNRGEQVVRRILDQETQANGRQFRAVAVTRENYDFTYLGQAAVDGRACYRLALEPKRKEKDLVRGEALVDQRTFQVRRIEGDMAKTPSWWLKKVHVKMAFADVQGAWLETNMEAVADVRIFGPHTLSSQLVNFRSADVVARSAATTSRGRRSKKADPAYSAVFAR